MIDPDDREFYAMERMRDEVKALCVQLLAAAPRAELTNGMTAEDHRGVLLWALVEAAVEFTDPHQSIVTMSRFLPSGAVKRDRAIIRREVDGWFTLIAAVGHIAETNIRRLKGNDRGGGDDNGRDPVPVKPRPLAPVLS